ncbi:MAG: ABC transporter ATP-binding protein [Chloroflexi bacterium]|nr:ABC transporter ATP-binding protein [Chloroflexota bacterium]MBI3733636.1 ABC transporter ATP-binding protein [Chloroflexota bacterium]
MKIADSQARRLLATMARYKKQVFITYFCLFVTIGLNLLVPWLIKLVIDQGLSRGDRALMVNIGLLILGLALVRGVFGFGLRYLTEWLAQRVAYDLRNELYDKIQRISFAFHDKAHTGDLMSRATSDVEQVQRFIGNGLLDLTNIFVLLVASLIIMLSADVRLTLLTLTPIPVLVLVTIRFGMNQRVLSKRVQEQMGKLSTTLQENSTGVRVVKAFAREDHENAKFNAENREYLQRRLAVVRSWASTFPFMNFIIAGSTAILLGLGGQAVMRGEISVGTLVAFNSYIVMLALPVQRLGFLVNMLSNAGASGERLYEILDEPSKVQEKPDALTLESVQGLVRFEDVTFAYGERPVLRHVSFTARPNEVIALMGPTGSGKSTIIALIPRFYDVKQAGRVTVDGHDIRDVTLASLRRQIGIVLQETFLFSATIRANIAYGHRTAPLDDVIAAAQAARAHDFIMALPDGYETRIGERGVTLSGGQRQRLAIARALLLNPRILILDDSLSNVDTETEYLIQQALSTLMQGRTTFVIAQRLITLKSADQILVLDHGAIVQRGTHEQLLAEGGLYRRIYDLQLRDQEETARYQPAALASPEPSTLSLSKGVEGQVGD